MAQRLIAATMATAVLWVVLFFGYALGGVDTLGAIDSSQISFFSGSRSLPLVRIGTALGLNSTGLSAGAKNTQEGWEVFCDWLHERGGLDINGTRHQLELVMIDDQNNGSQVQDVTRYLIAQGINLLLSPYGSTLTLPAARVAHQHGAVMVAAGAAASEIYSERPGIFGILPPAAKYMERAFKLLRNMVSSVSYITEKGTFTEAACNPIRSLAAAEGMEFRVSHVLPETPDKQHVDAAVAILKMDSETEFLVVCAQKPYLCPLVLSAMEAQDFSPKATVFTICAADPSFLDKTDDRGKYVLGPVPWVPNTYFPTSTLTGLRAADFVHRYQGKFGKPPQYHAANAWASAAILVMAIERAETTDPVAVAEQLRNMTDDSSIIGPVAFGPNGQRMSDMLMVQWVASEMRTVETEADIILMQPWQERTCSSSDISPLGMIEGKCKPCPQGSLSIFSDDMGYRICEPCARGKYAHSIKNNAEMVVASDCIDCWWFETTSAVGQSECKLRVSIEVLLYALGGLLVLGLAICFGVRAFLSSLKQSALTDSPVDAETPTGAWIQRWTGPIEYQRLQERSLNARVSTTSARMIHASPHYVINASPFTIKWRGFYLEPHTMCMAHCASDEPFMVKVSGGDPRLHVELSEAFKIDVGTGLWESGAEGIPYKSDVQRHQLFHQRGEHLGDLKVTKRGACKTLLIWSPPQRLRGIPYDEFRAFLQRVIDHQGSWNCSGKIKAVGDKTRNMHEAYEHMILPDVATLDASYAELYTNFGAAQVFVSHVWAEEVGITKEAIDRLQMANTANSLRDRTEIADWRLWFCTTCNNQSRVQGEIGNDILQSSFAKVLQAQVCTTVAMISPLAALERKWCNFEFHLAGKVGKEVLLLTEDGIVQKGHVAPYKLEQLAAKLTTFNCRDAVCSCPEDEKKIDRAIGDYAILTIELRKIFNEAITKAQECTQRALDAIGDTEAIPCARSLPPRCPEVEAIPQARSLLPRCLDVEAIPQARSLGPRCPEVEAIPLARSLGLRCPEDELLAL